jgi:hypothetical protein
VDGGGRDLPPRHRVGDLVEAGDHVAGGVEAGKAGLLPRVGDGPPVRRWTASGIGPSAGAASVTSRE